MKIKITTIFFVLLNLISGLLILQIKFECIHLFTSNFTSNNITNINEIALNLSFGIISSTLFYIVVVFYPHHLKRKSAFNVIQPRLDTIANQLHQSLHYLLYKKLNNEIELTKMLLPYDFETITRLDNEKMNIRYKIIGSHGNWIPFGSGNVTEIEHFIKEQELVTSKINEIFNIPTINHIDDELLSILAKLKDSWFYSGIKSYHIYGERSTVYEFNKGVYDYYKLYLRLKEYANITTYKIVE